MRMPTVTPRMRGFAAGAAAPSSGADRDAVAPGPLWERATADRAGLPPTWGLKVDTAQHGGGKSTDRHWRTRPHAVPGILSITYEAAAVSEEARTSVVQEEALRELASAKMVAMREVHTRLARLYPEYAIAHMPSTAIQQQGRGTGFSQSSGVDAGDRDPQAAGSAAHDVVARQHGRSDDDVLGPEDAHASSQRDLDDAAAADCDQFVGNAAVYGDCFRWHIDADPAGVLTCSSCLYTPGSQPPCGTLPLNMAAVIMPAWSMVG